MTTSETRILFFGAVYVALAVAGDAGLKLWADRRVPGWSLLVTMAIHAVASASWAKTMRLGAGFGRSAVILIVANLAGAVLMSRVVFHEALTLQHLAGLAAAAVAVGLLA